jgi:hypothetical protein
MMTPFVEGIYKRYGTLAVIGVIVLIAGVVVCMATRLAAGSYQGLLSSAGTISSNARDMMYVGAIGYHLGLGILSISFVCGSIFDEKKNPYVRLGMLIATGFLLSYGIVAGSQLVLYL